MGNQEIRAALDRHRAASDTSDFEVEHATYDGKPSYTVSIMEFRGDKVARETQYFADPFQASAWRAPWVEPLS
ncbi:MAG TPA: hypothetical protein VMF03_20240 [Steroidobacteraceae bacterium]|nr:hypothetical protein [Steroidobacteraceae bacterium]